MSEKLTAAKEFFEQLIELEVELTAYRKVKNLHEYNARVETLKSFCVDESVGFGHPILDASGDTSSRTPSEKFRPEPRALFKVIHHIDHGDNFFRFMTSTHSPIPEIPSSIANGFILKGEPDTWKFVAGYFFSHEGRWKFSGGDKQYKMKGTGELQGFERLREPVGETSLALYHSE